MDSATITVSAWRRRWFGFPWTGLGGLVAAGLVAFRPWGSSCHLGETHRHHRLAAAAARISWAATIGEWRYVLSQRVDAWRSIGFRSHRGCAGRFVVRVVSHAPPARTCVGLLGELWWCVRARRGCGRVLAWRVITGGWSSSRAQSIAAFMNHVCWRRWFRDSANRPAWPAAACGALQV